MIFPRHVSIYLVVLLAIIHPAGAVSAQKEMLRVYFETIRNPSSLSIERPVRLRVSCEEGKAIVGVRGYSSVRTIECLGDIYTYLAYRNGDNFKVAVKASTGRIAGVDRTF
jgi:hypothetical protein